MVACSLSKYVKDNYQKKELRYVIDIVCDGTYNMDDGFKFEQYKHVCIASDFHSPICMLDVYTSSSNLCCLVVDSSVDTIIQDSSGYCSSKIAEIIIFLLASDYSCLVLVCCFWHSLLIVTRVVIFYDGDSPQGNEMRIV